MPASGSPSTRSVPEEGRSSPAATLSSVDFPQPVGPTTETNSPSPIASVTSRTAVYAAAGPRPAKVQVMLSKETAAGMAPLPVFRVGLLHKGVVERPVQVHLAGLHHRRLELVEHLVDVLGRLERHH